MNRSGSIRKKQLQRTGILLPVLFALFFVSACGNEEPDPLCPPGEIPYAATERSTITVERGDLVPVYEQNIKLAGFTETEYRLDARRAEELKSRYEVTSQEFPVDVGDRVKTGDLLLAFHSETLDKKLRENQAAKEAASLLLEHYQNLMTIDPDLDYKLEIEQQKEQIALCDLYISDIQASYAEINLIAECDGVVSYVDESVKNGSLPATLPVVKTVSDDGYYVLKPEEELGTKMEFSPGEVYPAKGFLSDYEVELTTPPEPDPEEVYFSLVADIPLKEEMIKLVVTEEMVKDAVYIESRALIPLGSDYYVYKEQADGSFRARKVTIGPPVGTYVVIRDGLEEGDVISLPNH